MNVARNEDEARPQEFRVAREASIFRRWESVEESQTFARNFSKALVESLVRGEGAVAVWIDGQIVWHTKR